MKPMTGVRVILLVKVVLSILNYETQLTVYSIVLIFGYLIYFLIGKLTLIWFGMTIVSWLVWMTEYNIFLQFFSSYSNYRYIITLWLVQEAAWLLIKSYKSINTTSYLCRDLKLLSCKSLSNFNNMNALQPTKELFKVSWSAIMWQT